MSFLSSRRLVGLFAVIFVAAPLLARADVPKPDDPNDDRNFAAPGARSDEEIKKCQAFAEQFKQPAATCKGQAELSLEPKMCDDSEAIGLVNSTKQLNRTYGVDAFAISGIAGFGGQGTSQESCKAVSKNNSSNYDTLAAVRSTCSTAKKTCEDVCGQVKAGLQKVPAMCNQEMAPAKKEVYRYVARCGDLQKKIDRLSDQMQIVKNEERPLWESGGCMVATSAGTEVEKPNNNLHKAIEFDDRFGDKGPNTGQIMLKDPAYRQMLGISDVQAERLINAKPGTITTDMLEAYSYRSTTGTGSGMGSGIDWSAAAQPALSQETLNQLGQQYAPSAHPVAAIGPADTGPSVNSAPASAPAAVPATMPTMPQTQAAAASAPVTNPNTPAYDITALPQTPKYDQSPKANDPTATTGPHQAGALYGGQAPATATATAETKSDDAAIQPLETRTIGGLAPMPALKEGDSAGLSGNQSREFVNGDATGAGSARGPAAVRGAGSAGDSSSSSSTGGRIRSFISSIFSSGDDKPARSAGSDFRFRNSEAEKEAQQPNVDLRQFLPGELQPRRAPTIAGMNPLRQKGIHGSETILWNAVNDRYKALAPTLMTEP